MIRPLYYMADHASLHGSKLLTQMLTRDHLRFALGLTGINQTIQWCTSLPVVTTWRADRMSDDDYSFSRSLIQRLMHHRPLTSRKTIASLLLHESAIMACVWLLCSWIRTGN